MSFLEITSLKKVYTTRFGANEVTALKNVSFTIEKGEYVAVMGESGSGKTTLLNILAALDRPTAGSVMLNGEDILKPGGFALSFGWNTNGVSKKRGFEIVEVLVVAHGGSKNDTLCTVERKLLL